MRKHFYLTWQDDGDNLYLTLPYELEGIGFSPLEENLAIIDKKTLKYKIHKIVGDVDTCHGNEGIARDDIDLLKEMIEDWIVYELENRVFYFTKLLRYVKRGY